jgi:tRNA uridine 5-carbamoylmethylation protein Kti12
MMIAMANVWFKEDLCDREYIDRYVEPEGLKRWRDYVLGIDDGEDKTPKWVESICGVPAETIEGFSRLYAGSKPVNLLAAGFTHPATEHCAYRRFIPGTWDEVVWDCVYAILKDESWIQERLAGMEKHCQDIEKLVKLEQKKIL